MTRDIRALLKQRPVVIKNGGGVAKKLITLHLGVMVEMVQFQRTKRFQEAVCQQFCLFVIESAKRLRNLKRLVFDWITDLGQRHGGELCFAEIGRSGHGNNRVVLNRVGWQT